MPRRIRKTKIAFLPGQAPKLSQNDPRVFELWVRAGGRCEFHGCNKYLLQDSLTSNAIKLADIAHIVARTKDGPRGNDPLPFEKRNDIDNLMLVCPKCHRVVDNKMLESQYPKQLLQKYKRDHEDRIRYLSEFGPEYETVVIRMRGNIRGDTTAISNTQIRKAVLECTGRYPRYLGSDTNVEIDLSRLPPQIDSSGWREGKKIIDNAFTKLVNPCIDNKEIKHLSIFAIARIPFLIYLGSRLSDKVPTCIYQKHRYGEEGWIWRENGESINFHPVLLQKGEDNTRVALILSINGKITRRYFPASINGKFSIYEIAPTEAAPNRNLIRSQCSLQAFRDVYQTLLRQIEKNHARAKTIHLFPAVPISVAMICGRELLKGISPALRVYDANKEKKFTMSMEVT